MCCEKEPLVSVIMGVRYRQEDTGLLEQSVRSIQEQTYRSFELLVCDDGSTAEAKALLERLAATTTGPARTGWKSSCDFWRTMTVSRSWAAMWPSCGPAST